MYVLYFNTFDKELGSQFPAIRLSEISAFHVRQASGREICGV